MDTFERDTSGFDFAIDRPAVTDEALLAALATRAAQLRGRPLTMADFDAWPDKPCNAAAIARRLGWRNALERAGIRPHSPEALMRNLRTIWKAKGSRPRALDLQTRGPISPLHYTRRWRTLRQACHRLALFERGEISSTEGQPRGRESHEPEGDRDVHRASEHSFPASDAPAFNH